ncbi:MAG: alpha/beta fold hydrolase [Chloroflexi bacterium]|nr:alpha/beta fold hydrolase [Chloroflexota bacterium]
MPQFPWLDPSPFSFPGGQVGCLLIHGFTGAPPEMRPMGEYLAQRGVTVSCPLLAGHGTTHEDLARTTWQDWYASVEAAFVELQKQCTEVFVAGFSLGSLLALHLATQHELDGIVLLAPALQLRDWRMRLIPVLRYFLKETVKDTDPQHSDLTDPEAYKRFWSYDIVPVPAIYQLYRLQRVVRAELGRIRTPALVIYSTRDMAIAPQSGPTVYKRLGSEDKELLVLHHSGHGLVVDSECQLVFQKVYEWIIART